MKKTAYEHPNLIKYPGFHWGLNLEGVKDIFFVTGQCDHDKNGVTHHIGDPVGQTRIVLKQMEETYSQAGYTKENIVSINWCVTKEVTQEQSWEILEVWNEFIKDVEIKPSGGTWKRVDGLILPDFLVEPEMILAR